MCEISVLKNAFKRIQRWKLWTFQNNQLPPGYVVISDLNDLTF